MRRYHYNVQQKETLVYAIKQFCELLLNYLTDFLLRSFSLNKVISIQRLIRWKCIKGIFFFSNLEFCIIYKYFPQKLTIATKRDQIV